MPKIAPRTPEISTRLNHDDLFKFRELAQAKNMTVSSLLRVAAKDYLRRYEQNELDEIESIYAQELKASTNRICSLLAKVGIDSHAILLFLCELEDSAEKVAECRARAAKKIRASLTPDEEKTASVIKRSLAD